MNKTSWSNKTLSIIFPTFFEIDEDIFKSYNALESRTFAVAKLFADLGVKVNIIAPRGSTASHKNITVLSGDNRAWDGHNFHPYDGEKNQVISNLDVLKNSDAILEDSHFGYLKYLQSLTPNEFPKVAYSFDHHPDQLSSLPNFPQNVICVSKWQLSVLREKFKNLGHNFYQAYSGLILENYPDYDLKDKEDNLYLFLARFSTVKAPHICIEVARENPNDNFILLGDSLFSNEPHYARKLKQLADSMDNLKIIFNASYDEKIDYLKRATGILHPGSWDEPLGWDTLEGLYFGCKALSFDRGSTREIYRNEKEGLIIPFSNNESQNIEFYKRGFKKLKTLKIEPQTCRDRIISEFDFKKKSFPVYQKVLFGDSK